MIIINPYEGTAIETKTREGFFVIEPIYGDCIFRWDIRHYSIENSYCRFKGKYYRVRSVKSGKMHVNYMYFHVF